MYVALVGLVGVGFLIAAQMQSGAVDAYRNARECPDTTSSGCYQLSSGTIRSVSVNQRRSGEQDTTVIETRGMAVTVVLEPAGSDASHIRTGAPVTVEWYQGKVSRVVVDGIGVPSTNNPAAQESNYWVYGILLLVLAGAIVLLQVLTRRRKERKARLRATSGGASISEEPSLLQSGELGWIVKPALKTQALAAFALGVGFLALTTLRVAGDPGRTALAVAFDFVILGVGGLALLTYIRNSRVIASRQQITRVNWLGRSTTYRTSDIRHVDRFSSGRNRYLVFAGPDGRQLFRVSGIYWDFDRFEQLCDELGLILVGSYDEIVGAMGVNKRAQAPNNWGATALALGALTVAIVAFVVLLAGPASR